LTEKSLIPRCQFFRQSAWHKSGRDAFKRGTLSPFPIFIDSPMAIEATKIYRKHPELFDDEALAMQKSGEPFLRKLAA
jgi:hypothetical protein